MGCFSWRLIQCPPLPRRTKRIPPRNAGRVRRARPVVPPPVVAVIPPPVPIPPPPAAVAAAVPVPAGRSRFPVERVVDVDPASSPRSLKFIGPYLTQQFSNRGYVTLQQILDRLQRQSRTSNSRWLKNILVNVRANGCIADPTRSTRRARAPHGYSIRPVNWFAYNSILTYARMRLAPRYHHHIPVLLTGRTAIQAYPNRC